MKRKQTKWEKQRVEPQQETKKPETANSLMNIVPATSSAVSSSAVSSSAVSSSAEVKNKKKSPFVKEARKKAAQDATEIIREISMENFVIPKDWEAFKDKTHDSMVQFVMKKNTFSYLQNLILLRQVAFLKELCVSKGLDAAQLDKNLDMIVDEMLGKGQTNSE